MEQPDTVDPGPVTPRTRLRRLRERGRHDRATIEAILDEGFVCHVGFTDVRGPVVIPTAYARDGDRLYLHGAAGNAALAALRTGSPVCVTVTLVDGLVLARSAFHHSVNYRSVVVFATASEVTDPEEKRRALEAIVEHIVPGRGADARPVADLELRVTRVVRVPLDEASAKVRTGGPKDDPEDMELPVWAGEIPLRLAAGAPVADACAPARAPVPGYAAAYRRPR
ncbi:MAG TPA: pyridoxamine 5'-phosphate oxidase family protein [Candidatus Dormibacteraeota bacterium]|nr:pyridoxamine 5'-phosphate oxidase family protein [Candidatus Dormibacteraeota bacterium]